MTMSNVIIVTPAHNEEAFIEKTLDSMIAQTLRPLRWVVVNDASSDGTREIVERYASRHDFIRLVNVERAPGRHFGNKVFAFNRGMNEVRDVDYEYIGNLDADISLERDYYESVVREFEKDSQLGIAGGKVYTRVGDRFITHDETLSHVGGAVQLFRRKCFQDVAGYMPLPFGGIDAAAEITARVKGWRVRKFPSLKVLEHRRTGTAQRSLLGAKVHEGRRMYSLGYDPLFFFLRCVFRSVDQPFVIGSVAAFVGYFGSLLQGQPVLLPEDVVAFSRAEQRQRLRSILVGRWLGLLRSGKD